MKRFIVVGCPKCHWIRGVNATAKTMTCPRCGKRTKTSTLVHLATAEKEEEMRCMIAVARRKKLGLDTSKEVAESEGWGRPSGRGRTKKMTAPELAHLLSDGGEKEFTVEEFLAMAEKERITKPESKLEQMMDDGMLMEPVPGKLRWLGE